MIDSLKSFGKVWTTVLISLCYSYLISSRITNQKMRFLSLIPVILIFVFLPLSFSSVNLQVITGLFISWLANFKLLLFVFDQEPFTTKPSLSLLEFIVITSLPVRIKKDRPHHTKNPKPTCGIKPSPSLFFLTCHLPWLLLTILYTYKNYMPLYASRLVYTLRAGLEVQFIFELSAYVAHWLLRKELEPQFNNPYFATSIQDFWGRRWNLTVSSILRSSVYNPVRSLVTPFIGRRWALHPAVLATFIISGLMHEMAIYYVLRKWPRWEVLWFFTLNGIYVAAEIEMKKALNAKWRLQPRILRLLVGFIVVSHSSWWLYNPLIVSGMDVREMEEFAGLLQWGKQALQPIWLSMV